MSETIPPVMKAAQQSGFGNVREVLTLRDDVPVPRELSSGQVLVRVHAASINPVDWKTLNGNLSLVTRFSFPHVPGKDVAGVIVDKGSKVQRFQIGDHVYGNLGIADGSYAEYLRADQSVFSLKPKNLTMEEAAAIPLACETSYQALFSKISPPIGKDSKLLVCGGTTATGLFAVQLAKAVGASVTITSSQRNFRLLEQLGYNLIEDKSQLNPNDDKQLYVIDYTQKDFAIELKGEQFDVVYDCVGGQQQWISAQQILKPHGQFITIVGDDTKSILSAKAIVSTGSSIVNRKFWSVFGSAHHNYTLFLLQANSRILEEMTTKFIETDQVKPVIDTVFDWKKDGIEALYSMYEKSKSGKAQGKLILKIADES